MVGLIFVLIVTMNSILSLIDLTSSKKKAPHSTSVHADCFEDLVPAFSHIVRS